MSSKSTGTPVLLTSLPGDVVLLHVVPYLSPRDIGNMSKINKYFRNMFNSAHPWRNVQVCLASADFRKNKFSRLLETMKMRRIRNLKMVGRDFNFLCLKSILESLPCVERLSLPKTTNSIVNVLLDFASKDQLRLKKITFGKLVGNSFGEGGCPSYKGNLVELFKSLSSLEDVCVGPFDWQYEELLLREIAQGLCSCSARLKSITLTNCTSLKISSIKIILAGNPELHTLHLLFIGTFDWDCRLLSKGEELKEIKAKMCPNLQVLSLKGSDLHCEVPTWHYNCNPCQITGITSLDLSLCHISDDLARLFNCPDLRKLHLAKSSVVAEPFFHRILNLPHLEWLELNSCRSKALKDTCMVQCIMANPIGSTLRHLGLANLQNIKESELKYLPIACPQLRSLDLSACSQVTDALLVEWYMKGDHVCLPKFQKLGLKACKQVTRHMVDSVRLKTRNQLLIDR